MLDPDTPPHLTIDWCAVIPPGKGALGRAFSGASWYAGGDRSAVYGAFLAE